MIFGMKTIKVFLASSEELIEERKEFGFLFSHLNRIFRPRGIYLELVLWEFLDSSMGPLHKQQDYNKELELCEMCMVIYWTKFGQYTYEEFSHAYERLKQGYNPRKLYVFFKEPGAVSPELQRFKDSFGEEYGHFYSVFKNIETLKFEFIVQLEAYQNTNLLQVEDSVIRYDQIEVSHINNVPFIVNDTRLKEYMSKVDSIEEKIELLAELYEVAPDEDRKYRLYKAKLDKIKLLEVISNYEQSIINNALQVAKMTATGITKCARDAVNAFKQGDILQANLILQQFENEVEVTVARYESVKALMNQEKQNGIAFIDTIMLKISFLLSSSDIPLEDRIKKADSYYRKAVILMKRFNLESSKQYSILLKYTLFLIDNAWYDRALENCSELESLCPFDYDEKGRLYNLWGGIYDSQYHHNHALDLYKKAYRTLIGTDNIIELYNTFTNLGSVMYSLKKYNEALEYYKKALQVIEDNEFITNALLSRCYTNIGVVYDALGNSEKSIEYHNLAVKLYKSIYDVPNINLALCYNNIGSALLEIDSIKALEYFHKALSICTEVKGYYHPTTSVCYMNMGQVYELMGEYGDTISCYGKALEIRSIVYGDKHEMVATTLLSIGAVYYLTKEYEKALLSYEKAAVIYKNCSKKTDVDNYIKYLRVRIRS